MERVEEYIENAVQNLNLLMQDRGVEDIQVSVKPDENTNTNSLKVDMSVKFKKPIETFTVTFDKPEGMTDEQFEVFIKHLQKQIEENNIHEGELTN